MAKKVILKNRYCKVDATMAYDKVYEPLAWMPRKTIDEVLGGKKAIVETALKWYMIRSKAESDARRRGFVGNLPSVAADDIIQQFGELFHVDMGLKKL